MPCGLRTLKSSSKNEMPLWKRRKGVRSRGKSQWSGINHEGGQVLEVCSASRCAQAVAARVADLQPLPVLMFMKK
jgi:hypothetical protein